MQTTLRPLPAEFTFAGFTFPRYIADLPKYSTPSESLACRTGIRWAGSDRRISIVTETLRQRRASRKHVGPYYSSPTPNSKARGIGFYARDDAGTLIMGDGGIALRVEYTDAEYSTPHGDTTFYGIVARLPKSRGFLAGWTMGPGMASSLDCKAFDSLHDAQTAADCLTESAVWEEAREQETHEQAEQLQCDIDALVDEVREKRELVQILVMARNNSKRDPTTERLCKQIKTVRTDTHNIVDRVRVLRERYADNFARVGY